MKLHHMIAAILSAGLLLVAGCDEEVPTTPVPSPAPPVVPQPAPNPPAGVPGTEAPAPAEPPVTGEQVKKEIGEAATTTGEYLGLKSQQWLDAAGKRLEQLDTEIAETRKRLAAKAEEVSADAKQRYEQLLLDLEEDKAEAKARWESLKESSGEAWAEARTGFEAAMNDAVEGLRNARRKLANPETPEGAEPAPGAIPDK